MAKVEWSAGIDSVSGALAKPGANPQHRCNKMLLGTHRVAETTSIDCNRLYLRKKVKRASAFSADELDNQQRFATVAAAVVARKKDLSRVSTDRANYFAQKDQPGGKRTMKSYLWSLELATYDQAHPRN